MAINFKKYDDFTTKDTNIYYVKGRYKKEFLYGVLALLLLPIILMAIIIYYVLHILQLLFRTINLQLEKFMEWVDRNITVNM